MKYANMMVFIYEKHYEVPWGSISADVTLNFALSLVANFLLMKSTERVRKYIQNTVMMWKPRWPNFQLCRMKVIIPNYLLCRYVLYWYDVQALTTA